MLTPFRSLMLGTALAAGLATAPALALDAKQKGEIETLIREYLVKNPEVIQEALIELDRRQREADLAARQKVLKDEAPALYSSKFNAVVGNPDGDVTLVEFFDYNCGFCKRAVGDLEKLMKEDPKLKIVLKDLPILSPGSREAAAVALAVKAIAKPDKFWEFHTKLMTKTGAIAKAQAMEVALAVGIDKARLEEEMGKLDLVKQAFDESRRVSDGLAVTGTPAYVLADEVVVGAVGVEQLKARIANVRRCGKNVCG
jgi:protein-disulfide isomerase